MPDLEAYLQEFDELLLDQGDDWMLLTQLDGYLTGIAVCPELVPPSAWLKPFGPATTVKARHILTTCRNSSICRI